MGVSHVETAHDWKGMPNAGVDAIAHNVEDLPVDKTGARCPRL